MLSATRQNTIMDTMLPAIVGDRRMSRLLAQLVFILAGGTLLAASAQFMIGLAFGDGPANHIGRLSCRLCRGLIGLLTHHRPDIGRADDWHGKGLPVRDPALFMGGCDEAGRCGLPDAGCLAGRQGR